MKKAEIYKYPRNILIPVILLIIGMVVVFVVYRINSSKNTIIPEVSSSIKLPVNTTASFNVDSQITIGDKTDESSIFNLKGDSILNIDIANGKIIVKKVNLKSDSIELNKYKLSTNNIFIQLNPSYPSTGEIDLNTGNMDVSLNITLKFKLKDEENKLIQNEINMTIPLSGNIDRNSGIIRLTGEATIPPSKILSPIPISAQVIATTDKNSKPTDNKQQEN